MIYRLVRENLTHRPVRTFLSALFIGVQVTMILTLVGVSRGVMGDIAERSRGTGADILIRPPNSTVFSLSGNMKSGEKLVARIRRQPHVALATGTLVESVGNFDSITGIHLDEFNAMSGGFHYFEGGPFQKPDDLMVDQDYARSKNLHVGSTVDFGRPWHICAVVESGKLSRMFAQIDPMQEMYSAVGEISVIYVKADNPANTDAIVADLQMLLPDYKVFTMKQFTELVSVDNFPLLKSFTRVVMGMAVVFSLIGVLLSMYTAVLERTHEIGILKALGASPGYIMAILLREAVLLGIAGSIAGILMGYGTRWLMHEFVPTMPQVIVPDWWPYASLIALGGSLLGALYPGMKAARQDAIEALSYD